MSINNCIPVKYCFPNTPTTNRKKPYIGFHDNFFLKLFFDEKSQNIIIICYDTTELEIKKYETKLSRNDLDNSKIIFKIFDNIEEIYELIYDIFKFNRFKIIILKDNILSIELNFKTIVKKNNLDFKLELEIKQSLDEDLISDFNYILRNEMINLKKKYNKEISDLKFQNNYLIEELNKVKQIIKDLYKNEINKNEQEKNNDKDINLKGQKSDNKDLKLINYKDSENLYISNYNKKTKILNLTNKQITNISLLLEEMKFQTLNELYLSQNKIIELEPLAQFDLTHIQKMDLSFNYIDDINAFYRVNAPKLKYLNLSHNNITDIKIFGIKFNGLEELYLDNNKIDQDLYYDLIDYLKKKLVKFSC